MSNRIAQTSISPLKSTQGQKLGLHSRDRTTEQIVPNGGWKLDRACRFCRLQLPGRSLQQPLILQRLTNPFHDDLHHGVVQAEGCRHPPFDIRIRLGGRFRELWDILFPVTTG